MSRINVNITGPVPVTVDMPKTVVAVDTTQGLPGDTFPRYSTLQDLNGVTGAEVGLLETTDPASIFPGITTAPSVFGHETVVWVTSEVVELQGNPYAVFQWAVVEGLLFSRVKVDGSETFLSTGAPAPVDGRMIIGADGSWTYIRSDVNPQPDTVVLRDSDGHVKTDPAPTNYNDAASKFYVDQHAVLTGTGRPPTSTTGMFVDTNGVSGSPMVWWKNVDVVYGRSGWRVLPMLDPPSGTVSGRVLTCRIGGVVHVRTEGIASTEPEDIELGGWFREDSWSGGSGLVMSLHGVTDLDTLEPSDGTVAFTSTSGLSTMRLILPTPGEPLWGSASYPAARAWPDTLPGTPA